MVLVSVWVVGRGVCVARAGRERRRTLREREWGVFGWAMISGSVVVFLLFIFEMCASSSSSDVGQVDCVAAISGWLMRSRISRLGPTNVRCELCEVTDALKSDFPDANGLVHKTIVR